MACTSGGAGAGNCPERVSWRSWAGRAQTDAALYPLFTKVQNVQNVEKGTVPNSTFLHLHRSGLLFRFAHYSSNICYTMARKARIYCESGVYHVMLRGINRQDIFESEKDYIKFLYEIRRVAFPVDETGRPMKPGLVVYAYCLMPNHVHLLVKELDVKISDAIKCISGSYAGYFNLKYEHVGHLFQDRFRSEIVNDMEYFVTLLRYIHQNPIAGGLVDNVKDYRWSSWREFDPDLKSYVPVCCTGAVFQKISFDALKELVDEPLPKTQRILDFDSGTGRRLSDDRVREYIRLDLGISEMSEIQHLEKSERNEVLKQLLMFCENALQISRVTGISRGITDRIRSKM